MHCSLHTVLLQSLIVHCRTLRINSLVIITQEKEGRRGVLVHHSGNIHSPYLRVIDILTHKSLSGIGTCPEYTSDHCTIDEYREIRTLDALCSRRYPGCKMTSGRTAADTDLPYIYIESVSIFAKIFHSSCCILIRSFLMAVVRKTILEYGCSHTIVAKPFRIGSGETYIPIAAARHKDDSVTGSLILGSLEDIQVCRRSVLHSLSVKNLIVGLVVGVLCCRIVPKSDNLISIGLHNDPFLRSRIYSRCHYHSCSKGCCT